MMFEPRKSHLAEAARLEELRRRQALADPEPSLGSRLGQIGVLGWLIVSPMLLALLVGRWLDRQLGSGIEVSGALLMLGTAIGAWSGWKWLHRRL